MARKPKAKVWWNGHGWRSKKAVVAHLKEMLIMELLAAHGPDVTVLKMGGKEYEIVPSINLRRRKI